MLNTNEQNKRKAKELRKWKADVTIFNALAAQEQEVDTTIWKNDLLLGNPNAPVLITVACNPYCGPCAKAHAQLDELLEQYPNEVAVQVKLLCNPSNADDKRTIATTAILQKASTIKDRKELQVMLTDWFYFMDLEKWQRVWKIDANIDVNENLEACYDWKKAAEIKFTPSFFINGKALSTKYNIEDLQKIIPDLAIWRKEMILQ